MMLSVAGGNLVIVQGNEEEHQMFDCTIRLLGKSNTEFDFTAFIETAGESPVIVETASDIDYTFAKTGITILFSKPYSRFTMVIFHLKTATFDGGRVDCYRSDLLESIECTDSRAQVKRKIGLEQISSNISHGCEESLIVDTYKLGGNKIKIAYSQLSNQLRSITGFYDTSQLIPCFD